MIGMFKNVFHFPMCFVGSNQLLIVLAMLHVSNIKEAKSHNAGFLQTIRQENMYD